MEKKDSTIDEVKKEIEKMIKKIKQFTIDLLMGFVLTLSLFYLGVFYLQSLIGILN